MLDRTKEQSTLNPVGVSVGFAQLEIFELRVEEHDGALEQRIDSRRPALNPGFAFSYMPLHSYLSTDIFLFYKMWTITDPPLWCCEHEMS